jgi:hypothetical protein
MQARGVRGGQVRAIYWRLAQRTGSTYLENMNYVSAHGTEDRDYLQSL